MKKAHFAETTRERNGFHFTAYSLLSKKVWDLPLTEKRTVDGKPEKVPTTVGAVYESLPKGQVEIHAFDGPSFNREILRELLNFGKDGIDPFWTWWFWYDIDQCMEEPNDIYSFFVVYGEQIVREQVQFSDNPRSGFDPSVFDARDDREPLYSNQTARYEADTRFWYRKFYTETRTGQVMVLRHDHPRLYDYEKHRSAPDSASILENAINLLKKMHMLMWVLIALVCLMLIRSLR
jgi:hypothetical protein